jgi:hypothetical protein
MRGFDLGLGVSGDSCTKFSSIVRLMRHLANIVERMLTPYVMLSDCHLHKHRLINSLWTKVSERGWGSLLWADSSALLNPQNFANTIGKPILRVLRLSLSDRSA